MRACFSLSQLQQHTVVYDQLCAVREASIKSTEPQCEITSHKRTNLGYVRGDSCSHVA
jgi:hypothetical protein